MMSKEQNTSNMTVKNKRKQIHTTENQKKQRKMENKQKYGTTVEINIHNQNTTHREKSTGKQKARQVI